MTDTKFPAGFLWGAATSAYQIEGSPLADGAGASIWHRFAHTPGRIADHSTGDIACDHYRRFAEDVRLMRELGIQAYRFSISWSRVLPEGVGRVNPAGVDFYRRLVNTLLEHGIEPMVTLYHWDLPAALEDRGGWVAPEVADWFAEYAQLMFRSLGDRARMWATINEPWVVMDHGYVAGEHAPGLRDLPKAVAVSKNLLRAHAAAVQAGRAEGDFHIGLVVNLVPIAQPPLAWTRISIANFWILRYWAKAQPSWQTYSARPGIRGTPRSSSGSGNRSISWALITI